jgi:hypothetical protein
MNSRCGLEDCDCEYTIGGLLRRLELIIEQVELAKLTVIQTRKAPPATEVVCPCYDDGRQEGYEAERPPVGA